MPIPIYEELLKKRVVFLHGAVKEENANVIIGQILKLSIEDPNEDIVLLINSPGGSITEGVGIYDMMELIPNDVITIGIGMAASMGQFLLTMGTPGKRFATPGLRVLLHQPLGGTGGTATEQEINYRLIQDMKNNLATLTASRTGKTKEQVIDDGDRDNWFSAAEALDYGFVDHIVTNIHDEIPLMLSNKNSEKGNQ